MKQKTIKQILENAPEVTVPYEVWTKLGSKHVSICDSQISFGDSDFASIEEMQVALTWYVHQFGGTVKWSTK